MAVYLLHFDQPLSHARHYIGYADDDKLHSFTLARVWRNADRHFERRLKQRGHTRKCPICRPNLRIPKGQR